MTWRTEAIDEMAWMMDLGWDDREEGLRDVWRRHAGLALDALLNKLAADPAGVLELMALIDERVEK